QEAENIIKNYKPEIIILGTSENRDSFAFHLIKIARQHNIKTIGVIDSPANAPLRFKGYTNDIFAYAPDSLWVIDDLSYQEYLDLSFPSKNIKKVGHPFYWQISHQHNRLNDCQKTQLKTQIYKTSDKVVLFLGEISAGLNDSLFQYSEQYSLHGFGNSLMRTEIVLEEVILQLQNYSDIKLFIKPHPKDKSEYYQKYAKYINGFVGHNVDSIQSCKGADLIIGMSTSLLMEAYFAGCGVLSVLTNKDEKKWINYINETGLNCVWTRPQLAKQIRDWYIEDKKISKLKPYEIPKNPISMMLEDLKHV
ncbi:MAG: hypothetical protein AAF403_07465, partial [Pseudomonadota bacterium]